MGGLTLGDELLRVKGQVAHVDHLYRDAGIAFATAPDEEKLTAECFGGRVAWVPWRRPGFKRPGRQVVPGPTRSAFPLDLRCRR